MVDKDNFGLFTFACATLGGRTFVISMDFSKLIEENEKLAV